MSTRTILKLIPHMNEGTHSLSSIAERSGLRGVVLSETLEYLSEAGIGVSSPNAVCFSSADKLAAAVAAIKLGVSVNEASNTLSWRDFEALSSELLKRNGYAVYKNLRVKKSRLEIDVFGVNEGISLALDCKHWKKNAGVTLLRRMATEQVQRALALLQSGTKTAIPNVSLIIPAILTLKQEGTQLVCGVPVIPIDKFQNFILEFEGNLDALRTVQRSST